MLKIVRTLAVLGVVVGGASLLQADSVSFVRGDANGNGHVDGADAAALMTYLATGSSFNALEALDVDDNGRIDRSDVRALGRTLADPQGRVTPTMIEFKRGDVNGDRVIDARDVGAIQFYLHGGSLAGIRAKVMDAADANSDRKINLLDLFALIALTSPVTPPPTT